MKVKIFDVIPFGSIGWESFESNLNDFMKGKDVIQVLQSIYNGRLIVTIVYRG